MDEREPTEADAPDSRDTPGAFELAVGALARKERTIAELREWLAARDVEPADAEDALARLVAIGELDDEHFARRYAEDKRELQGWGPERICRALVERGIERPLAERAAGAESHAELAERGASLLLGRGAHLGDEAGRRRALAYLARRGFGSDAAYAAVRLAERRSQGDDRRAA